MEAHQEVGGELKGQWTSVQVIFLTFTYIFFLVLLPSMRLSSLLPVILRFTSTLDIKS